MSASPENISSSEAPLPSFERFFEIATGRLPYAYQQRLAGPDGGKECGPLIISVPTGLGKTAAVVLAWLWNRMAQPDLARREKWPRRLVYCLPMRTLVEQTRADVEKWIRALKDHHDLPIEFQDSSHLLMGGEEKGDWDIHPERNAMLIGTQDMLLSRALNRGYGMSRFRWPMHFGLLNNDCLWIMDEVQLMGNGMATSIQLDGFRNSLWAPAKPCVTWWMSATTSNDIFSTTDRNELKTPHPELFNLTEEERSSKEIRSRLHADKSIEMLPAAPEAAVILKAHEAGKLTLVVLNTVKAAIELYDAMQAARTGPSKKTKGGPAEPRPEILLLHSRFRRFDRARKAAQLKTFCELTRETGVAENDPGLIVIATQVIEAGVDLSAAALYSEIAPWASDIQRLGRLNRDGNHSGAIAKFWKPVANKSEDNAKDSPNAGRLGPYEKGAIDQAISLLDALVQAQKKGTAYRLALDEILESSASKKALKLEPSAIIRADDVHGLFSTEPDLTGGFTDISPFIRGLDLSNDVTVYWREFKPTPPDGTTDLSPEEIISIPSFQLSHFLKNSQTAPSAFQWNDETKQWDKINHYSIVAGMTLLLPTRAGGYSSEKGWTGNAEDKPETLPFKTEITTGIFDDPESETKWQLLTNHITEVTKKAGEFATLLDLPEPWHQAFRSAGEWHDVGKAHPNWQGALPKHPEDKPGPWGKFSGNFVKPGVRVRHEAFSLLAAWKFPGVSKLALYLIASHHGKIRTVLRSSGKGDNFFGWKEGDAALKVEGIEVLVDLSVRNFSGAGTIDWENKTFTPTRPSWINIVDELLGPAWPGDIVTQIAIAADEPRQLGPFQLAYLEAIFRAADARASQLAPTTEPA